MERGEGCGGIGGVPWYEIVLKGLKGMGWGACVDDAVWCDGSVDVVGSGFGGDEVVRLRYVTLRYGRAGYVTLRYDIYVRLG